MNKINTIDLWTEQTPNHLECFCGAFVDGFEVDKLPFNKYKIVKNCNCIIVNNGNLNIGNKHNAIVFYNENRPVRLIVINQNTDVDKCIQIALNQEFNDSTLGNVYKEMNIQNEEVDLKEQPVYNNCNGKNEIDVGSCDRKSLLDCMLEGSYTQSNTDYGKSNSANNYSFAPDIVIQYKLVTDCDDFEIEHYCAFINEDMTRIIPLQENSLLNVNEIRESFCKKLK